jgi:hypothetical protein
MRGGRSTKILFGPPVHYTEDGEVASIKHIIYVQDFSGPTLVVPILAPIVPRLVVGSDRIPSMDFIKQVEYRLRGVNEQGVAAYEFVSYKAAVVDL